MQRVQVPILRISERIKFGDLPIAIAASTNPSFGESIGLSNLVFFLPGPEPRIPTQRPTSLIPEDSLVVVSVGDAMRNAALLALKRVELRESETRPEQKTSLKLKENTPLKAIFRKMSEMPITALSLQLTEGEVDGITVFFLRTRFTVTEFRREMEKQIG